MGETELQLRQENEVLRLGLEEARETLAAIQSGEVDALVIDGPAGEQVYSLKGVDHSYRVLIEEMHEGALILAGDGTVLYANRFIEKIIKTPLEEIIGSGFGQYVDSPDLTSLDAFLSNDHKIHFSTELKFIKSNGTRVPVLFSANRICLEDVNVICVAAADLSEQKRQEAIMAQELLNRSIIEQSVDAIIVCDDHGIVIRASKAAHKMAGQNCVHKKFRDLFNIQIRTNNTSIYNAAADNENFCLDRIFAGQKYHACEAIFHGKEALTGHLLLSAAPLRDDSTKVIGAIVNLTDISEHIELERRLKESEKRYREVVEDLPGLVCSFLPNGEITFANRAYCQYFSKNIEELIGFSFLSLIPENEQKKFLENIASLTVESPTKSYEHQVIAPNGELRWQRWTYRSIFDKMGKIIFYQSVGEDITQRKNAEYQLRFYEQIVNTSEDLMAIVDDKHVYCAVSDAYGRYYDTTPQAIVGRKVYEVLGFKNYNAMVKPNLEKAFSGENVYYEGWFNYPLIQKRFMIVRYYPVREPNGKISKIVSSVRDMTERKKLESELTQAQKMESVGRLAGGIAHDFNNMLSIINGYADLVLEKINPFDPIYDDILEIQKAGQRSKDLTRQLLAFARKQVVSPKVIDLNSLIEKSDNMLRRLIGEDISVKILPAPGLWTVKIDPSQVDQILVNLAVNSRDAISGVGNIIIETANINLDQDYCHENPEFVPGEFIRLSFSDDGCGMSRENQAQIFEPFYTTKGESEGTGLGLSTVYGIVKQNDGLINVYSEQGQGTTFNIYLPRHEGLAAQWVESPQPSSLKGSETILVVEDEEQILKICRKTLENKGYHVLTASKPGEAIILCEKTVGKIDLLITDVVMPTMNGKELMNRLKIMKPDLSVLFMSGYTANVIVNRGVIKEGTNFLQKPFSPKELLQRVREMFDAAKGVGNK